MRSPVTAMVALSRTEFALLTVTTVALVIARSAEPIREIGVVVIVAILS